MVFIYIYQDNKYNPVEYKNIVFLNVSEWLLFNANQAMLGYYVRWRWYMILD
jgi:hypothetical protein